MIYILGFLILFLNALDVLTTVRILQAGGVEKNPIVAFIMRRTGNWWIVIKAAVAVAVVAYLVAFQFALIAALVALLYLYVLANNIRVMRGMGLTWIKN